MTRLAAIDWDQWRLDYDSMTFDELCAFYDHVFDLHPSQAHFDLYAALHALRDARTVVEVGGWRGDLCNLLLQHGAWADTWTNFDVAASALLHPATTDSRYRSRLLKTWPWETDLPAADAFVATHVIEHMRLLEFVSLAEQFPKYRVVHLEAPLELAPVDWTGYQGSHILEAGWDAIDGVVAAQGFDRVAAGGWTRTYERAETHNGG